MVRLMLVLGLVLSLAACGGSRTDGLSMSEEETLEARLEAAEAARAAAEAAKVVAEAAKAAAEADKVAAEAAKVAAEAAKVAAEAAKAAAEAAQAAAEADKAAAEAAQAAAEADKAIAEADKDVAEAAKAIAEADKDKAEEAKAAAEAAKAIAEAAKDAAEAAKAKAEADKDKAEAAQAIAEAEVQHQLREAVDARQEARDARQEAETERQKAETARAEADTAREEAGAAQQAQQQAEEESDTAEQRAVQADARLAFVGLVEVTGPDTAVSVVPELNDPAAVTGVSDVAFPSGTGSSAGRGWYATTAKGRGTGIDADVVVYSDKTTLPRRKITEKYDPQTVNKRDADDNYAELPDEPTNEVRILQTVLDTNKTRITGSTFPTGGADTELEASIDDPYDDDGDKNNVRVRGSFDGASGYYWCQATGTTCTIDHDGTGYALTGGTWEFRTSKTSTVLNPDTEFMSFGWWRKKATAFSYGMFSTVHGQGAIAPASSLSGTAKYVGPAIGQYAISLPLGGLSNHGEFEATAELTATFGNPDTISGKISGFDVNPGWELTLGEAEATGATFTEDDVVWTIDDQTPAGQAGAWTGSFQSDDPDYDGTSGAQPHGITGTFRAAYGNTSTAIVARLIGAYGAKR